MWPLSTYALQTMVLYIFNLFHKELHTPLDCLYAFLRYYSEFDWSRYGLTIEGPVLLSEMATAAVAAVARQPFDHLEWICLNLIGRRRFSETERVPMESEIANFHVEKIES